MRKLLCIFFLTLSFKTVACPNLNGTFISSSTRENHNTGQMEKTTSQRTIVQVGCEKIELRNIVTRPNQNEISTFSYETNSIWGYYNKYNNVHILEKAELVNNQLVINWKNDIGYTGNITIWLDSNDHLRTQEHYDYGSVQPGISDQVRVN
jgi:hypothetical protein